MAQALCSPRWELVYRLRGARSVSIMRCPGAHSRALWSGEVGSRCRRAVGRVVRDWGL
ncbi:UNVERIFIED_CONTAM: hypothetical protein Slati_2721500 [Sesamum latifolium]|uniref:Uncharacterized protein n=1 Tax=Sesamum latifolium TaxID=2727402 RepID=A0AAW2VW98_9LAMI